MKRFLAALGAAVLIAGPVLAAPVTVSTPDALWKAVKACAPGGTVLVASGAYGVVEMNSFEVAAPGCNVRAAPGAHPVFSGLVTQKSQGLNFSGIEVAMTTKQYAVQAPGASRIRYDNMNVHQADNSLSGVGFFLREASDISVTNSQMHHLGVGLTTLDSERVTARGNLVHDIGVDGFDFAGTSGVVADRNEGADFFPAPDEHPDFIQFWATASHPSPAGNVVTNNVFRRGKGRVAQGVFIENQTGMTIAGNALSGTMFNGIGLSGVNGAQVTGNFLQGYADMGARIIVRGESSNVVIKGNTAELIVNYVDNGKSNPGFVETGNTRIRAAAVGDLGALNAWLAKSAAATPAAAPR